MTHLHSWHRALTVLIAAGGAALFSVAGLPLPFLFGPMSACLIAALMGAPLKGLGVVSVGARTILGVAVGASVTPALVHQLPLMAASVALMPVYIALIALIGVPFFNRYCGFDPATSFYAAMPGGLQDMVIFGQEAGGNVRVGLEDSLWAGKGRLAESNAQQVRMAREIIENMGLEVATADEARQILDLKGGDRTNI